MSWLVAAQAHSVASVPTLMCAATEYRRYSPGQGKGRRGGWVSIETRFEFKAWSKMATAYEIHNRP